MPHLFTMRRTPVLLATLLLAAACADARRDAPPTTAPAAVPVLGPTGAAVRVPWHDEPEAVVDRLARGELARVPWSGYPAKLLSDLPPGGTFVADVERVHGLPTERAVAEQVVADVRRRRPDVRVALFGVVRENWWASSYRAGLPAKLADPALAAGDRAYWRAKLAEADAALAQVRADNDRHAAPLVALTDVVCVRAYVQYDPANPAAAHAFARAQAAEACRLAAGKPVLVLMGAGCYDGRAGLVGPITAEVAEAVAAGAVEGAAGRPLELMRWDQGWTAELTAAAERGSRATK